MWFQVVVGGVNFDLTVTMNKKHGDSKVSLSESRINVTILQQHYDCN